MLVGPTLLVARFVGQLLEQVEKLGPSRSARLPPLAGHELQHHVSGDARKPAAERARSTIVAPAFHRAGNAQEHLLHHVGHVPLGHSLPLREPPQKRFVGGNELPPSQLILPPRKPHNQAGPCFGNLHGGLSLSDTVPGRGGISRPKQQNSSETGGTVKS